MPLFNVRVKTLQGDAQLTIAADTSDAAIRRAAELGEVVIGAELAGGSEIPHQWTPAPAPRQPQSADASTSDGVANGIVKAVLALLFAGGAITFMLYSCQLDSDGAYDKPAAYVPRPSAAEVERMKAERDAYFRKGAPAGIPARTSSGSK